MKLKYICLLVIVVASIGGLLGNPLQVTAQLSPQTVNKGGNVTISVFVKDLLGNPVEGANVTATVGDLEILYLLSDKGQGKYEVTIDTSILKEGTYEILVSAQKTGYRTNQALASLTATQED
jgi:hypothetical protein